MSTATPDANEAVLANDAVTAAITCSQCKTTTPWKESSWCPECGYYPGITDAVPEAARPVEDRVPVTDEQTSEKEPPLLPVWVSWSIGGATAIISLSIAANYYFTYYGGDRSLISLLILLTGVATFLGAHIRTSIAAMQESADVAPFDIIGRPIEMWRPTIHGLPKTGRRIICGVCGASAVFSALFVIGGLDFNSIFEKEEIQSTKPGVFKRIVSSAANTAPDEDPESVEEALEEFEPIVEELDMASSALLPSPDEPLQCIVYGFMKDGKDDFGRLLLAAEIRGTRVHVATIPASRLPAHIRENLASRLPQLVTEKPGIETRYSGTFVTPSVALDIDFQGWSMSGELIRPKLSMKSGTSN